MTQQQDMFCPRLPEPDNSLRSARQRVQHHLPEGITCPCCGQLCKLYRRSLNSGMTRSLIWLVRYQEWSGEEWIDVPKHAPRYVLASREMGKLVHWGLAEDKPNDDDRQRTSGMWRPTKKGIAWVYMEVTVPSHVLLYNNQLYGFSGQPVNVQEALGQRFDYETLMHDPVVPEVRKAQ